jgi:uroporphyrin-III C-methyltransferase / precorrin-2 dehydrogenase / sirohydrochlorin ferrochelatase
MHLVSRKPAEAPPSRIGRLAKLPVFFDLAGRRAVVAGGTAAAAWKCELLAAAGARVDIYAQTLEPEMAACVAASLAAASDHPITHHAQAWTPDVLAGAAIALADIECESEAAAFARAAEAAGVPVNVIDKPALCQFQFGSIVNRSPVVIGISTDGAAPILAQAIRQRIETLLPPSLAQWGALARAIRATVMARLARGAPRRRFWDQFVKRAFAAAPAAGDQDAFIRLVDSLASAMPSQAGHVTLVGAGPGDAELLTLKAVRALQSADVILYDDLVSQDVIELARREAKRMLVGKRGRRESCRQEDINELMIKLARQGKHVVRLKSGDPMIFGRAGEEIVELERHGIDVTVVPGITAALAAASAFGVSLTHRDHAHSVRFVTGHARNGELSHDLDWRGLADPQTTLVFYMGGRTAPGIAKRLLAQGLAPSTPVVVASGISRDNDARWRGTLTDMTQGIGPIDRSQPILIGIGQVFANVGTAAAREPTRNGKDALQAPRTQGASS